MYDQGALDACWDLVRGWSAETREGLRIAASVDGLQAEAGGVQMLSLAREVLAIARTGLDARGFGEGQHLEVLADELARGRGQADDLLALYHGAWGGDLSKVYTATRL
jgi:glutamate--cysteine ligase